MPPTATARRYDPATSADAADAAARLWLEDVAMLSHGHIRRRATGQLCYQADRRVGGQPPLPLRLCPLLEYLPGLQPDPTPAEAVGQ